MMPHIHYNAWVAVAQRVDWGLVLVIQIPRHNTRTVQESGRSWRVGTADAYSPVHEDSGYPRLSPNKVYGALDPCVLACLFS